jgi:hypothetical protein
MRAKLLTSLGVVFLFFSVAAQEYVPEKMSIVSYKDGSIFRGTILYANEGSLRMIISTGDTISLRPEMIEKIFDLSDYIVTKKDKYHYKSGVFSYTSLILGSNNYDFSTQLQTVLGYRYTDRLSLGAGVSLEAHDLTVGDGWFYHRYLSSFGYGRYYLNNKNWRLYTDAKMGYAFALDPEFFQRNTSKDGFIFQPGVGVHMASRNKFKMHFGMSYVFLRTAGTGSDWSGDIQYDYKVWINRLVFNVGLELW